MNTIKASDIKPGHNVVTLDGQIHRVRNVSRGWWTNSVMIHWSGGWACVGESDMVESPNQPGANADCAAALTHEQWRSPTE